MSFLYPYLLWGLVAVAIPVIIHLFNFRKYRRVYFTNVRFLEDLKLQTHKQSQLRHLIVMLLRMLAIASIALAFSQPYLPSGESNIKPDAVSHVSIYLDNSFSMEALSTAGSLLDMAKMKAREIASAYRSSDLFMLTTNDFEGRHQRWVSQEEFLQYLDEVTVTPGVRTVSEIIHRQTDAFSKETALPGLSYLISDFQISMADFENVEPDSLIFTWLVPLNAVKRENLYIDSCWFTSPVHQLNQSVQLVARVTNDSGTDYEKVPLKLSVNGKQKALASFDVKAGLSLQVELPFTNYDPGIQYGQLEITDYPVVFDDKLFLVYDVSGSIPVLAINDKEESTYLNSLYGRDSSFRFVNNNYKNIDYSALQSFELIILNELKEVSSGLAQELAVYLENSGTLLVIPSPEMDLKAFQDFLVSAGTNYFTGLVQEPTKVSGLDLENPLFADVFEKSGPGRSTLPDNTDLPLVSSFFGISRNDQTAQLPLMIMQNGRSFLTFESAGNGQVYLLAVPLAGDFSTLPRHAVFVPVMYRIALLSAATDPLYYTIGRDHIVEVHNASLVGDKTLKISSSDDDFEFIPAHQNLNKKLNLQLYGQIQRAGHYSLHKDEEIIKGLGFNYNRLESVMEFAGLEELKELVSLHSSGQLGILAEQGKPLSETIKEMSRGRQLWKLFIILALAFLAAEVVLLRYWKINR